MRTRGYIHLHPHKNAAPRMYTVANAHAHNRTVVFLHDLWCWHAQYYSRCCTACSEPASDCCCERTFLSAAAGRVMAFHRATCQPGVNKPQNSCYVARSFDHITVSDAFDKWNDLSNTFVTAIAASADTVRMKTNNDILRQVRRSNYSEAATQVKFKCGKLYKDQFVNKTWWKR